MDLSNQFLIAMPSLNDPNFSRTVTLLCAHSDDGAMGLVINRPLDLTLGDVLKQMDLECDDPRVNSAPVLQGGPVQCERGFVLHRAEGEWEATMRVSDELAVAASRDILAAVAEGRGPRDALVLLGYAGWGAGQLEQELAENAWLSGPVDTTVIFETPYELRWERAARLLGVDVDRLSGEAGHA